MSGGYVLHAWDDILPQGRIRVLSVPERSSSDISVKSHEIAFRRLARRALQADYPAYSFWSHASRWPYVVVGACERSFGLDIERADVHEAAWPIGLLRPDEVLALQHFPQQDRAQQFGLLWSAKESFVKALGMGFVCPPEAVDVTWLSQRAFTSRHVESGIIGQGQVVSVQNFVISFCFLSNG
jgi:phosphopantetheinyl transferase